MQRGIQFRTQDLLYLGAMQRFDHPIGEHPSGVDHRTQRIFGRDRSQCRGQLIAIGYIDGGECHLAALFFQFVAQLLGTVSLGASAADQQQMPALVHGGQMTRQRHTQHTRTPGDQHRAARIKYRRIGFGFRADASKPRRQHDSLANSHPRLSGQRHRCRHTPPRGLTVVEVNPHEPTRLLRSRAAQQPFRRCRCDIRAFPRTHGHRRAGDKHQPRLRQLRNAQPGLQHAQRAIQPTTRSRSKPIVAAHRRRRQHHLRSTDTATNRLGQRDQIRVTLHILTENRFHIRQPTAKDRHTRTTFHRVDCCPIHHMQRLGSPAADAGQLGGFNRPHVQ
uniref:Uncharacterized protein n=1 Tax=Mycobacterium riyadhense TaxID=486698 RepID=A0A653EPX8_9MYCO|nr:hypothetical protein BIN_B_03008 [Mycobacterium riyadhense]